MKKIIFAISIFSLILTGCNSSEKKEDKDKNENNTQAVSIELNPSEELTITNPKGKIQLYAIPELLADAPASLIVEKEFEISKLPATIDLNIPENHTQLITPAPAEGSAIKYYVSLEWDSDNSGQVEQGDIAIDYDRQFPTITLDDKKQTIYLRTIK